MAAGSERMLFSLSSNSATAAPPFRALRYRPPMACLMRSAQSRSVGVAIICRTQPAHLRRVSLRGGLGRVLKGHPPVFRRRASAEEPARPGIPSGPGGRRGRFSAAGSCVRSVRPIVPPSCSCGMSSRQYMSGNEKTCLRIAQARLVFRQVFCSSPPWRCRSPLPGGHPSHFGDRAVQVSRPKSTIRWQKLLDSFGGWTLSAAAPPGGGPWTRR